MEAASGIAHFVESSDSVCVHQKSIHSYLPQETECNSLTDARRLQIPACCVRVECIDENLGSAAEAESKARGQYLSRRLSRGENNQSQRIGIGCCETHRRKRYVPTHL